MNNVLYTCLLICALFAACGTEAISEAEKQKASQQSACSDITASFTESHTNFRYTKTFIVPPEGYQVDSLLPRIYKDAENYIQVRESQNIDFNSRKYFFSRRSLDSMGSALTSHCEIRVNGYNAYMITGFNRQNDREKKTEIIFGDSSFTTLVFAAYDNEEDERRTKAALQTICYRAEKSADAQPFIIETADTPYRLNSRVSGIYVYTIDGSGDPLNGDHFMPHFQVYMMPYVGDTSAIRQHLENIADGLEAQGITTTGKHIQKTFTVNRRWSHQHSREIMYRGRKGVLYYYVTASLEGNLVLLGTAYSDVPTNVRHFEKIARTLDFTSSQPR